MSTTQVVLFALLGAGVVFALWNTQRQRLAWAGFAARHGLAYTGSSFRLELRGQHRGRTVSVGTEKRMDEANQPDTLVRLDVSDVFPRELTVRPDEFRDRLLLWLGMRDEQPGDTALDPVRGAHRLTPQTLAVLRAPSVREHLLGLRDHYSDCSLADGVLKLEQLGVPGTVDAMEVLVGPALDLGEALDEAARTSKEQRA